MKHFKKINPALGFILYHYLILSWASKKKYRNGSAISILIPVLGVAIGVFAFVVVISVMTGFVQNIQLSMIQSQPHMIVSPLSPHEQIPNESKLLATLKSLNENIVSVMPFQKTNVIIQAKNKAAIVNLLGIDPHRKTQALSLNNLFNHPSDVALLDQKLPSALIENSALFPTVLLGIDLMDQLQLNVGDNITLVSPNPNDGPAGLAPTQLPVVVAGYLYSGHFSFDKKMALSSIKTVNTFLENPNSWQGFYFALKDPFQADKVAEKITPMLRSLRLQATPWTQNNKALLKALTLEHYGMIFVLLMVILVGCFSITISLLLSLRRKAKEMAILRSLGLSANDLMKVYMAKGFIIGLFGAGLGLLSGFFVLYLVHHYPIPFITTSYSSEPLPVAIHLRDIFIVTIGSLILSILAALWPALETKKLDVVEVLSIRR